MKRIRARNNSPNNTNNPKLVYPSIIKLMILPNAINNMMYVSIIAIERVFLEKVYLKIRYPYARNEPANSDLNSDAVSKFPA